MAQKITANLWFDHVAKEAADFYVAAFAGIVEGSVNITARYPETAEEGLADFQKEFAGKELVVEFELGGQRFMNVNAGPEFTFNQSVSFMVNFDPSQDPQAREHLDMLWEKLTDGGETLMELKEYSFSKRYGWCKDRYGLSWQLILTNPEGDPRPFIVPSLLFCGEQANRAGEAIDFYRSVFSDAQAGKLVPYAEETGSAKKGAVMYADIQLAGQWFALMDSTTDISDTFNEAVSFSIACKDQAEIDYFWEKLSSVPESEQCGWCKDRYGVSWQVIPANMGELMQKPDAFAHMMQMKKLVIADF